MTTHLKSALTVSARTHQGLTRSENQDASYTNPSAGFIAVADGLGGHQSGKLCAELTTGFFEAAVETEPPSNIEDLFQLIKQCNHALIQHQKNNTEVNGMRTTLVCGQIT
ncbi:MAG: protein phosphatase 2C domain-containing protein, partial [Pseudomonadales bacterium]|nr:protein phosphatase 2C domain-containing protein [Pseudomonadales bacterium]